MAITADHFNSKKSTLNRSVTRIRVPLTTLFKLGLVFLLVFPIALTVWLQGIISEHDSYISDEPGVTNRSQDNHLERSGVATASVPGLWIGKPPLEPVPSESANRYSVLSSRDRVVREAFNSSRHNWSRTASTNDPFIIWEHWYENAMLVWSHRVKIKMSKPWQRMNHFPGKELLRKSRLPGELIRYKDKTGQDIPFIPELYRLDMKHEKEKFVDRLQGGGGMDVPWVLKNTKVHKGAGVSMLGPRSEKLRDLKQWLEGIDSEVEPFLIEKYICNELTYEGHKFDLRVYMFVASVDPLIVYYYHDGSLRLTHGMHNETNFNSTKAHLTNISQNRKRTSSNDYISGSFTRWEELLNEHIASTPSLRHISDPLDHIRSQMKAALAICIEAVRETAFHLDSVPQENLFSLFGADFIVDKDLNVWFIEVNASPGMGFAGPDRSVCNTMIPEVLSIVKEISVKQANGEAILPLKNVDGFELIYTVEEVYRHDFGGKRKEGQCL